MNARLLRWSNDLRESYWFVPTVMAVAALLLALAMVYIDSHAGTTWMDRLPWLYAARPDGARSLLSSIGGSMIGVAGTTFSVTIAAVVYASGQYGPRLLSNFMSDRGNQVTLGTFIATFVYSLVVLRTIRSAGESGAGAAAFVPQLALLVALILVLCSIAVLIFFIHHVPMRIHINNVIERIGDRLIEEIDARFPVFVGVPLNEQADDPRIPSAFRADADRAEYERRAPVRSKHTGYIQLIDESTLMDAASDHDLVIRLPQPEELNLIEAGKRYGWPYIYADGRRNPQDVPPNGLTMEDWDRMSRRMVMGYAAHAAPMQMAFNRGIGFARDTQGDAFVAFRGSWNRAEPRGYEVVRVRFDAAGRPTAMEPFLTGFLTRAPGGEAGWTGRPTGLAFAPDGSMLVTDSENGVLYRVRYTGSDRPTAALPRPTMAPPPPPAGPIAMERPETRAAGRLIVTSPAFGADAPLPLRFSDYNEKVSPPLSWTGAPAGTRSFAIIVDDPDAASAKPVIHWVGWNIPATATSLPEGLPGTPQLASPKMMRQGANQPGFTGWYGPRPPIGDRPHRYHFQVFALDTDLSTIPGATREELLRDMAGHVLARGEIVGTYAQASKLEKP